MAFHCLPLVRHQQTLEFLAPVFVGSRESFLHVLLDFRIRATAPEVTSTRAGQVIVFVECSTLPTANSNFALGKCESSSIKRACIELSVGSN